MEATPILLAMSGGTDSSVAAMKLQEAGYRVTGITFRLYEKQADTTYVEEARRVAHRLGIEHLTVDAREAFKETVVKYFVEEYMKGHTPVPCTRCNNCMKWPLLAREADKRGIYHIATGHYARPINHNGTWMLAPAADPDKDQSFFLWGLSQEWMARMVLPMGHMRKEEARQYARQKGFEQVARKHDSTGVCFCPQGYRHFLKQAPGTHRLPGKGKFVDEQGQWMGWHEGYPFYTIGQRRGLGLQLNRPVYVKEIDPIRNQVTLAPIEALYKKEFYVKDWNLTCPRLVLDAPEVVVKIRYRKQANKCRVTLNKQNRLLHIRLSEPLEAIAIGQAAAFYTTDGILLGGGIITENTST